MESPPQPPPWPTILIHASSKQLVDDDDEGTRFTDWYALELRGGGSPQSNLWRVFHDSPPLDLWFSYGTTSALVGSDLYLITGSPDQDPTSPPAQIHRLDTLNPAAGWSKSLDLPVAFSGFPPAVFVDGNSIYMFPIGPFTPLGKGEFCPFWGYIYDTIEQKGYPIRSPFDGDELASQLSCSIWGFWKEQNVVVAPQFRKNQVFQYNIAEKSWNIINGCPFSQFPNSEAPPFATTKPYTVMNGVLYLLDTESWLLYAYDLRNGKHQVVELRLSEYRSLFFNGVPRLVPLGDSKICFIYYADLSKGRYGEHGAILYAIYSISLHPHFTATILDMSSFCFSGEIVNCMPFDSFRQGLHTIMTADDLYYYPRAWRNLVYNRISKESKWLENKMQATPKVFGQLNHNMNLSGTKSISSLASSAPAVAYPSMSRIPSSASSLWPMNRSMRASMFTEFKGYLASKKSLLKKCIIRR